MQDGDDSPQQEVGVAKFEEIEPKEEPDPNDEAEVAEVAQAPLVLVSPFEARAPVRSAFRLEIQMNNFFGGFLKQLKSSQNNFCV